MLRRFYVVADVIIFVYEVPCIFWHYINVDEVSWITLKKLLQSAMELLQIATAYFITKCDRLLLQIATAFLLQSATQFITNCDRYYKVRWLLQIATVQGRRSLKYRYTKICLHLLWILKTLMFYRLFLEWGNVKERGALKFPLLGKGWQFKKKNSLKYYVYISSSCLLFGGLIISILTYISSLHVLGFSIRYPDLSKLHSLIGLIPGYGVPPKITK